MSDHGTGLNPDMIAAVSKALVKHVIEFPRQIDPAAKQDGHFVPEPMAVTAIRAVLAWQNANQ